MSEPRRPLKLPFALTITVFLALCVLMGLGTWQLQRLQEKEALLADVAAGLEAPPVPLPAEITDAAEWNYRPVVVEGVFDHARELHLHMLSRSGAPGYHILTPLIREGAAPVLVNRGWVPPKLKDPAARAPGPEGLVRITGIARTPRFGGTFVPESDARANMWFEVDFAAMAEATGLPLLPVLVEDSAEPAGPDSYPVPGQTRFDIPNNHLDYALTWYGLGLVLVVIYVVYLRRRR